LYFENIILENTVLIELEPWTFTTKRNKRNGLWGMLLEAL